jgi:hypothetical protein
MDQVDRYSLALSQAKKAVSHGIESYQLAGCHFFMIYLAKIGQRLVCFSQKLHFVILQ